MNSIKNKVKVTCDKVFIITGKLVSIALICALLALVLCGINSITGDVFGIVGKQKEITIVDINRELNEESELNVFKYTYESAIKIDGDKKKIFGLSVPFTGNSITLIYKGRIKVEYEYSDIRFKIDNDDKVVYVTLPKPNISNNINVAETEVTEEDNIFNPIHSDVISEYVEEVKEKAMQDAYDKGLINIAEENIQRNIENALADIGYTVKIN